MEQMAIVSTMIEYLLIHWTTLIWERNDFSYFNGESEILLDGGTEFKVVDDGTRVVLITDFDGYDETALERYMKLQITGVNGRKNKKKKIHS